MNMSDAEDFMEAAASDAITQLATELDRAPERVGIAMITAGLKSLVGVLGVEQTQRVMRDLADNLPQIAAKKPLN